MRSGISLSIKKGIHTVKPHVGAEPGNQLFFKLNPSTRARSTSIEPYHSRRDGGLLRYFGILQHDYLPGDGGAGDETDATNQPPSRRHHIPILATTRHPENCFNLILEMLRTFFCL